MKISGYVSTKLRHISFLAILCVVFGHSVDGSRLTMSLAAQWHVPWFFIVSGAMLSHSLDKHEVSEVAVSKLKSLVVPYILWCCVGFLAVGIIGGRDASVGQWLGIGTPFPAGNPHLWYLHCLIVFVFAASGLWQGCRILPRWNTLVFALIFASAFIVARIADASALTGTPTSPFYFLAGFLLKRYMLQDAAGKRALCFFAVSAFVAVLSRGAWFNANLHGVGEQILRAICVFSQIAFLWFGYDIVAGTVSPRQEGFRAPWFVNSVFFIYCCHGFVLNVLRPHFGQGVWLFAATTSVTVLSAWAMRSLVPKVYALLTGGRV